MFEIVNVAFKQAGNANRPSAQTSEMQGREYPRYPWRMTPRGGRREGAGRPPSDRTVTVSTTITPTEDEAIRAVLDVDQDESLAEFARVALAAEVARRRELEE